VRSSVVSEAFDKAISPPSTRHVDPAPLSHAATGAKNPVDSSMSRTQSNAATSERVAVELEGISQ